MSRRDATLVVVVGEDVDEVDEDGVDVVDVDEVDVDVADEVEEELGAVGALASAEDVEVEPVEAAGTGDVLAVGVEAHKAVGQGRADETVPEGLRAAGEHDRCINSMGAVFRLGCVCM